MAFMDAAELTYLIEGVIEDDRTSTTTMHEELEMREATEAFLADEVNICYCSMANTHTHTHTHTHTLFFFKQMCLFVFRITLKGLQA